MDSIKEYISEYILDLDLKKSLSFNSLRLYQRDLMDFDEFVSQKISHNFKFKDLSLEQLEAFAHYIQSKGKSIASVNRKLTALHGLWRWLRDEKEEVSQDPFLQLNRLPQFRNSKAKYLSEKEIANLLDFDGHDLKTKLILEVLYATGIRIGELTKLTLADIDLDSQLITIAKSARFKERVVPFNDLLKSYLEKFISEQNLDKNSKLLLNKYGSGVSEREVFRQVVQAAKETGIEAQISPSIIRNSFIKHLKDRGAHANFLQDITGQKVL